VVAGGLIALLGSATFTPKPVLVWNSSASAPMGLYYVAQAASIRPGDMVIARVPERYRHLVAVRGYLPVSVPLVKRVAAYAGDEVCGHGRRIAINQRVSAERRTTDAAGRLLPTWEGCLVLRREQLFLLTDSPLSLDGRYMGPTEGKDVIGKATLLWGA
jgi:conjugative transfer signal peptidase TraF